MNGLNGLDNIGNTCYLNSVLQILSNTKLLREYLLNETFISPLTNNLKNIFEKLNIQELKDLDYEHLNNQIKSKLIFNTLSYQLAVLFKGLWEDKKFLNVRDFKNVFCIKNKDFNDSCQHDAHEVFIPLLDTLTTELEENAEYQPFNVPKETLTLALLRKKMIEYFQDNNKTLDEKKMVLEIYKQKKKETPKAYIYINLMKSWQRFFRNNNSIVTKIFTGLLHTQIQCPNKNCSNSSNKFEPFTTLDLPLPNTNSEISLFNCLDEFIKIEVLDDNNKWKCEDCNDYVNGLKQIKICYLPKILIFNLKRFKKKNNSHEKNNDMVDYPIENLDIKKYISKEFNEINSKTQYKLYGVVNHMGCTNGGHYTASCRNNNEWYEFNDNKVNKITNPIRNSAYILCYESN